MGAGRQHGGPRGQLHCLFRHPNGQEVGATPTAGGQEVKSPRSPSVLILKTKQEVAVFEKTQPFGFSLPFNISLLGCAEEVGGGFQKPGVTDSSAN